MSLPHLTQPWSIPVIAMRFVSERKAERTTQSAWWKRSERQRKESCCTLTNPHRPARQGLERPQGKVLSKTRKAAETQQKGSVFHTFVSRATKVEKCAKTPVLFEP